MIQDLLKQVLGHHESVRYGFLKGYYRSQKYIYAAIMLLCILLSLI